MYFEAVDASTAETHFVDDVQFINTPGFGSETKRELS